MNRSATTTLTLIAGAAIAVAVIGRTEAQTEPEPRIVGISATLIGTTGLGDTLNQVFRVYDDGSIDVIRLRTRGCEPPTIDCGGVIPLVCDADLNYNGEVDFPDLMTILSAWGPCPGEDD